MMLSTNNFNNTSSGVTRLLNDHVLQAVVAPSMYIKLMQAFFVCVCILIFFLDFLLYIKSKAFPTFL